MQAWICIAKLIKGVKPHQAKLGDAKVTSSSGASIPALQATLQVYATLPRHLTDAPNLICELLSQLLHVSYAVCTTEMMLTGCMN